MTDSPSGWTPPQVSEQSVETSSGANHAKEPPRKLTKREAEDFVGMPAAADEVVATEVAAEQEDNSSKSDETEDDDETEFLDSRLEAVTSEVISEGVDVKNEAGIVNHPQLIHPQEAGPTGLDNASLDGNEAGVLNHPQLIHPTVSAEQAEEEVTERVDIQKRGWSS